MNKTLPNRVESNKESKKSFRKVFQIISTTILILAIGMAVFLPFRKVTVGPALAAPLPGIPVDDVTWVKTTETFNFNTPDDPTDDSIDYTHTAGTTESDSFEYEICDATPDCVIATVNITIDAAPLAQTVESSQLLSPNADLGPPAPVDDDVTMVENTWMNLDVLDNDDFGPDGPGTGPIRVGEDCGIPGPDAGDCLAPTKGVASVNTGPRSPDPAGLAYLGDHPTADYTNMLLISDSEVNEIFPPNEAAYTGVNLFITDLSGSLDSTLTTYNLPDVNISREPSGVAYNPANDFLYFADDGSNKIRELDPGDDGLYNTGDDVITSIDTSAFGNGSVDPSGAGFDDTRGNGHLLIADDVGEEIYDIDLGSNGILDDSDTVTHFDTTSIGLRNPEGVEFNPDNCTLFILSSKKFDHLIAETTIDGHLLRYLDIASIDGGQHATLPAGLAYAPASGNPSENNLYIVARGQDNNTFPLENDGKMFEVSFDNNAPPFVDAGQNDWTVMPNTVPLDGTVTDGCSPELIGVTTTWSVTSGPGTVTFGDPNAVDTTASFTMNGEYVLKLQADDGGTYLVSDEVTITVIPAGNQPPSVDAGPNQEITLPNFANLDGTVDDDGQPAPPNLTTLWLKVSGPGLVTFGDSSTVDTSASFSTDGVYVLRLSADDGSLSNFDEITIIVNPVGNQPPNVDAGPPQTINILSASLDGTVSDDGLPTPPALITIWSKVSGPGVVNFANASAVDTTASFSTAGVYVLRLTADDSELSAFDQVTITVNPQNKIWLPLILKSPTNP